MSFYSFSKAPACGTSSGKGLQYVVLSFLSCSRLWQLASLRSAPSEIARSLILREHSMSSRSDLDLIMPFKKTGNLQVESLPSRETPFYQKFVFQAFTSALKRSSPRDTSQCYACLDLCLRILPVSALAQQ